MTKLEPEENVYHSSVEEIEVRRPLGLAGRSV